MQQQNAPVVDRVSLKDGNLGGVGEMIASVLSGDRPEDDFSPVEIAQSDLLRHAKELLDYASAEFSLEINTHLMDALMKVHVSLIKMQQFIPQA